MQQQQITAADVFAPWAGPEERALRVRIHRARDVAQARASRSKHGRAKQVYWIAAQMAGDWVFCRTEIDLLKDVLASLARLFLVAGSIERLETPDE